MPEASCTALQMLPSWKLMSWQSPALPGKNSEDSIVCILIVLWKSVVLGQWLCLDESESQSSTMVLVCACPAFWEHGSVQQFPRSRLPPNWAELTLLISVNSRIDQARAVVLRRCVAPRHRCGTLQNSSNASDVQM